MPEELWQPDSKYLKFVEVPVKLRTIKMEVLSISTAVVLGHIKWYGAWRQYCFYPSGNTIFNHSCLTEISDYCKYLNAEQRARRGR